MRIRLMLTRYPRRRCVRCNARTDHYWWKRSGGYCGYCLADDALLPLTDIKGGT